MLQYRDFKFASKEDFKDYIEKRVIDYWENHSDRFSRVCEILNSWDGFKLGDDRCYQMFSYLEVFKKLVDNYNKIFSEDYGCAYYNLFGDVYDIINSDEDDIQERMDNDYYEHLFEDDENFFLSMLAKLNLSDDDLDESLRYIHTNK